MSAVQGVVGAPCRRASTLPALHLRVGRKALRRARGAPHVTTKQRARRPADRIGNANVVQVPWLWPLNSEHPSRGGVEAQRRAAERRKRAA